MKRLILINGVPGVGKSAVCRKLYQEWDKSVWLDGDWCWMIHPFKVTESNKRMVEDNIDFLLNQFIRNAEIQTIVFSWVIPSEGLMRMILDRLPLNELQVDKFSLVCTEEVLRERMKKDGRSPEQIQNSMDRMKAYDAMDTIKVDTTGLTIEEAAARIASLALLNHM